MPLALAHVIRLPWQRGDGFIRGLVFRKEEEITFPSLAMTAGNGTGTGLSLVHLFQRISGSVPSEEVKRGRSGTDGEYPPIWSIISTIHSNKKSEDSIAGWPKSGQIFLHFFIPTPFHIFSHGFDVKKGDRNVTPGGPLNCQKAADEDAVAPVGGRTDADDGVSATGRTGATRQKI